MQFFDCAKYFNETGIFQFISLADLQSLHMESPTRQGIFKPVTTDTRLPVRVTLVGLNGYVGDDYLEFLAKPNPMVYACQVHRPLVEKLSAFIEKYRSGLSEPAYGAFYFTNFVKVYPPASEFKGASQMDGLLKKSSSLTTLFRRYLKDEIIGLVKDGCRVFICFGEVASRYAIETFQSDINAQCRIVGGIGNNVAYQCMVNGEIVFVLSERHYAYYKNDTTDYLVRLLANLI